MSDMRPIERIATTIASIEQQQRKNRDDDARERKCERVWNRLSVISVFLATLVAVFAVRVSSHDSENQRNVMLGTLDEMKAEQRPVYWVGTDLGRPAFLENPSTPGIGQIIWSPHVTNAGKAFIAAGKFKKFIKLGDQSFVRSYSEPEDGSVLPPLASSQDTFVSIASPPGIPVTKFNEIANESDGIQIKIIATYSDLAHISYESTFCLSRLSSGAISFCKTDNEIK